MRNPAEDPIFKPLEFRNLRVENRIFRSNISGRFDNEDGSGTQTRINWEAKFARGGVGAVISSYVPVTLEGRIMAGYATIHRDDQIAFWRKVGEAVHAHGSKYILQLSHSGGSRTCPAPATSIAYRRARLASASRCTAFSVAPCRVPRSRRRSRHSPSALGAPSRPGSTASSCMPPTAI